MVDLINFDNVSFLYGNGSEQSEGLPDDPAGVAADKVSPVRAVDGVSFSIRAGEFVALVGRNGSGKSTIAKMMNALLIPQTGVVLIKGMQSGQPEYTWEIRRTAGMVFQNPDNQIVGTTVEEDVAFGVENLGIPPPEIRERIDETMREAGVLELFDRPPYQLSGGQKQRVAIAGILAMRPECIVLDEATAMLDPTGRDEVLKLVRKLNTEEGIAVIHITHHMDEVMLADRVLVVDEGKVLVQQTPEELFSEPGNIRKIGLEVPRIVEVFEQLRSRGFDIPAGVKDVETAFEMIRQEAKNEMRGDLV